MCGRLAIQTKIDNCGNQGLTEVTQPHMIDSYASRERVFFTSNPIRQRQAATCAAFGVELADGGIALLGLCKSSHRGLEFLSGCLYFFFPDLVGSFVGWRC